MSAFFRDLIESIKMVLCALSWLAVVGYLVFFVLWVLTLPFH
jgi:hypothetical protein